MGTLTSFSPLSLSHFLAFSLSHLLGLAMSDTHVSAAVIFDIQGVPDFKSYYDKLYNLTKSGSANCLYYGFADCGAKAMCREGYADAVSLLSHSKEVAAEFEEIVKLLISGPQAQLDIIKAKMDARLTVVYVPLDPEAMSLSPFPSSGPDTHVTILPEFTIPAGREGELKAAFNKFYAATKAGKGAAGCLYYGFGQAGDKVYCREGYTNADFALLQGADVKEMLEEPLKAVGEGGFKLNVVGPKAELEAIKPKLAPRGAIFWELDSGAFFTNSLQRL